MSETITFDAKTFKSFKEKYNRAVENKQEIFIFDGHELLTEYAKYLIEYINSRLN